MSGWFACTHVLSLVPAPYVGVILLRAGRARATRPRWAGVGWDGVGWGGGGSGRARMFNFCVQGHLYPESLCHACACRTSEKSQGIRYFAYIHLPSWAGHHIPISHPRETISQWASSRQI